MNSKYLSISIIGMGYVGLPLATALSRHYKVYGFDINKQRIDELKKLNDKTKELSIQELKKSKVKYTNQIKHIKNSNVYIVTVPTPVNDRKLPDMSSLVSSCKIIGKVLKQNDIVIFESTVYPGTTEEVCVPVLEKVSRFQYNKDFFCGYSPERINPGDKDRKLQNIVKLVSGSNKETRRKVKEIYSKIIKAGVKEVTNIKTAEASKIIENIQRDLNIALMNELSVIFNKLDIDTNEVIDGASTKWNFHKYYPGLVGGHCIGVDPYYLTYKAKKIGIQSKIILAGRKFNDDMPKVIAKEALRRVKLIKKNSNQKVKSLILGLTFKENCPDTRNSKVTDLIEIFMRNNFEVHLHDPHVLKYNKLRNTKLLKKLSSKIKYDLIILAVPHKEYIKIGVKKIKSMGNENVIFFDLKSAFKRHYSDFRL